MLLLGIDIGTSSIKVAVVDAGTQRCLATASYPETTEREIKSQKVGWAEQDPERWWSDVKAAIALAHATGHYDPTKIQAIGITYQMHGLVLVDEQLNLLRDAIIWCDSRAIEVGQKALNALGEQQCLESLLNFPGNFTAAKLGWVKENEPEIYREIYKMMLPGDYIAMKLSGQITSSPSMLSEGILWDFKKEELAGSVLDYFGFSAGLFPECQPVFSEHGNVSEAVAAELKLPIGTPICYKAGDQPNNALSLGVLEPGEIATTAGTSGVIYAVTDQLGFDPLSRVNTFAHVNHSTESRRLGVLLCINGTGISNHWIKKVTRDDISYNQMDDLAFQVPVGAEGLLFLPFGNGAERMLCNAQIGAHLSDIDLNNHGQTHIYRAVHEGIAFSFRYGLDIMREGGMQTRVVKAGKANMFLNRTFTQAFVNTTGLTLELYRTDGSIGAALGAGIGLGYYRRPADAFTKLELIETVQPDPALMRAYDTVYAKWKAALSLHMEP
ncbi:MAG TPA: FGGY family carbohydrate kinase [Arachidicoccus sp.]|nr:FGGY family carbohydrate kinase [Arachidicoccus sp.]